MESSSENRFSSLSSDTARSEKKESSKENEFLKSFDEEQEKPLSGFIFGGKAEEKTLEPADQFEDEEEEEEEKYFPRPFSSQSYPERVEEEEKRKQELLASVAQVSSIEKDEEMAGEEIEEPKPRVLELNIDAKEDDSEEKKVVAETAFAAEENPSEQVETLKAAEDPQPEISVVDDESKEVKTEVVEDQIPIKIVSEEKTEEPKLIEEGEKGELEEIIPITVNGQAPFKKIEVQEIIEKPLEERLEQEIEDQEKNNPDLIKVFKDEEGETVLHVEDDGTDPIKEEIKEEIKIEGVEKVQEESVPEPDLKEVETAETVEIITPEPLKVEEEKTEVASDEAVMVEEPVEVRTETQVAVEAPLAPAAVSESEKDQDDFKEKVFGAWEKYKIEQDEGAKEKIISEIGFLVEEDQEKFKDNFDVYEIIDQIEKSLYCRMIILEEKEKLEKESGKIVELTPFSRINHKEDASEEEKKYKEELLFALSGMEKVSQEERNKLQKFIVDLAEYLRFQKIEEEEKPLPENIELKKNLSRDELGKMVIEFAKEEIDKNGSLPEEEILKEGYQKEFEPFLKSCGLFDLEVLKRSNKEILETAKSKNIESIISLANSLDNYLEEKRMTKEKELRDYTAKSLSDR